MSGYDKAVLIFQFVVRKALVAMKSVAITVDSPADLPRELAEQFNISTIPLHIILDGNNYSDCVDIFPEDIFRIFEEKHILPTTSAISIGEYEDFFRGFTDKGLAVVHLSLSSEISSTHRNAVIAADNLEDVFVVDSRHLTTSISLLALKAAEMRDNGKSASEIAEGVTKLTDFVVTSFVLDDLEFLSKGGRCSALAAFGANVFSIKPSIDMINGALQISKKYRGKTNDIQIRYALDKLSEYDDIDFSRVVIVSTGVDEEQISAVKSAVEEKYNFDEVVLAKAGCTITSHCGKNTLGILFMRIPK